MRGPPGISSANPNPDSFPWTKKTARVTPDGLTTENLGFDLSEVIAGTKLDEEVVILHQRVNILRINAEIDVEAGVG